LYPSIVFFLFSFFFCRVSCPFFPNVYITVIVFFSFLMLVLPSSFRLLHRQLPVFAFGHAGIHISFLFIPKYAKSINTVPN
jgi:hypothetical protein